MRPVDRVLALHRDFLDDLAGPQAHFFEQILRFLEINKSARDDIRAGPHPAGFGIHYRNDNKDAVLGQMLTVAEHHFFHIADSQAVDHDIVGRRPVLEPPDFGTVHRNDVSVLGHHDIFFGNTGFLGKLRVELEHEVVAVDRDEEARPGKLDHLFQFIALGVPAGMDIHRGIMIDLEGLFVEDVFQALDRRFVARDDG